jgi:copper chaperone
MQEFQIPNMSCGHCVKAITTAVQSLDPHAKVQADVARHQVQVDSIATREVLVKQLTDAGYAPA